MAKKRILSGMRPTGKLHLGHYVGALENWIQLQNEYESFHLIADYHVLTTKLDTSEIYNDSIDMLIDWLAAGLDPQKSPMFRQSQIKEHTELYLIFSMLITAARLERNPTVKDQVRDLNIQNITYGHLGYPVLQTSDILLYKGDAVPVGEDQVPHVEFTREVARRFNHLYGKEPGYEEKAQLAIKKLGSKKGKLYHELKDAYQEEGDDQALEAGQSLIEEHQSLSIGDKERLLGYLEGGGKIILLEPEYKLAPASKMIGLDGQKMSKSYNNTVALRESVEDVQKKIKTMPTDPARVRRTDPGDPNKCPVWQLHQVYSKDDVQDWVRKGCSSAGIGCIECKQPIIDAITKELKPMQERAIHYVENPDLVKSVVAEGCEKAGKLARETMREVREAMGLDF